MTDPLMIFDLLLALAIVALAVASLSVRDLFSMIVLFIIFGLLSALAWVRLSAPDVALAEAAIGTGVTGALLLKTLHHPRYVSGTLGQQTALGVTPVAPVPMGIILANAGFCGLITLGLLVAFLGAPATGPGFDALVAEAMPQSGVEHPVTGVLLNFRAYDTLMEVVVLLAAVIAVWQIERGLSDAPAPVMGEVWQGFARLALPAIVVVGTYLLWVGAEAPGGAFQGGAVLAAVGLLLLLTRAYIPQPAHRGVARGAFVLGTAAFALVAILVAGGGRVAFEYPLEHAKTLILLIEGVVTLSIAVTLAALFHGREPVALSEGGRHDT
ncbi:hydrogenase subunit MbhD domain-containing protein [Roseinatronobacter monicus]|uniref:hydrogenase subunit MbhD domain-containing protein n=1 Tax=Roseinatronobacter monicus TaxID=393481 RepID=UPI003F3FCD1C